jgi:hypothetical protein
MNLRRSRHLLMMPMTSIAQRRILVVEHNHTCRELQQCLRDICSAASLAPRVMHPSPDLDELMLPSAFP